VNTSQCQRVGCGCCPKAAYCQNPTTTSVTVTYGAGETFTDECCTPCADALTRSPRRGMTVTPSPIGA
jgi:hypothetical protein